MHSIIYRRNQSTKMHSKYAIIIGELIVFSTLTEHLSLFLKQLFDHTGGKFCGLCNQAQLTGILVPIMFMLVRVTMDHSAHSACKKKHV